jgi:hypothetical protein
MYRYLLQRIWFICNFNIAQLVIDQAGCIISADSETAVIFQYEEDDLEEADITILIPAIKLPGNEEALTKVTRLHKRSV